MARIARTAVTRREGGSIFPGALIGPAVGAVAVWGWGTLQYGSGAEAEEWNRFFALLIGAPAGFAIGSVVSYVTTREERWVDVRIRPFTDEGSGEAALGIGVELPIF